MFFFCKFFKNFYEIKGSSVHKEGKSARKNLHYSQKELGIKEIQRNEQHKEEGK